MEGESDFRCWDELIPDALGLIFKNLDLQEVLQVIPTICKSWCKVVEGPYCWQTIDIRDWSITKEFHPEQLDRMLRMLITRNSGSLRELIVSCVNNHMFSFISEHAGSLQTLIIRRSTISDSTVARVPSKFSSLTTLDMSQCYQVSAEAFEAIGKNCKNLISLTWNSRHVYNSTQVGEFRIIAHTMPKLKHLSIAYLDIETLEVLEILSGCPELESLNIRGCWEVRLVSKLLEEKYPKLKVVGPLVDPDEDGGSSSEELTDDYLGMDYLDDDYYELEVYESYDPIEQFEEMIEQFWR